MGNSVVTIATVNVNGIRAAFRKGMGQWLTACQPDVLLLQETRAPQDVVTGFFPADDGWQVAVHPCAIKGRAGVAVVTKLPITQSRAGLVAQQLDGSSEPDVDTGRWLEADLTMPDGQPLTVVSTYLHSGTNTPELAHTMTAKYHHLDKVEQRLKELSEYQHPVVVAGDFNIAHENRDIANWKGNRDSAGFLPEERAYLTRWFQQHGWADLGRRHAGEVEGPYTWWSWRGQAFTNDRGWRIDYQTGNPPAAAAMRSVIVARHASYENRWTDHAPVVGEYEFG